MIETFEDKDHFVTLEEMYGLMGKPMDEIGDLVFPNVSKERRLELMRICTKYENEYLLIKDKDLQNMLVPAVIHGVMKDNISLWMAIYVLDKFGMQLEESTAYMLLIPALGFIGRISAPALYKKCKNKLRSLIGIVTRANLYRSLLFK